VLFFRICRNLKSWETDRAKAPEVFRPADRHTATCCSLYQRLRHITGIGSLSLLLGVKIVHLVDRTELFKISILVYDGREIVRSLYSSLQGQTVYGGYSKLAGALFVSVKIDGLGNFLKQLT
jgi:hypothetical protein